jgi:HK97 family phage portal protein
MKLLDTKGKLVPTTRSYPLAGMDMHQTRSPSSAAIPLGRLPSGETRMLAISRVYRTNPIVMACVHLLARGISTTPLNTYRYDSDGERVQMRSDLPPDGPVATADLYGIALDSLARKPAPSLSRRRLIFRTVVDLAIFGNGLASFSWGPYGPDELWPIPWRRCVVHLTDPMTIEGYDVWGAAGKVPLFPQNAIHWAWGDDPESPIGVSPIESMQFTIALHNAIDRHLVSYYANAARPSGVLKLARMPKEEDVTRIREQLLQLYTAPESAGNVIITAADFQPIAEATGVPTLIELVKKSRQEILSVYGIDPPMIGIYENAIKSNFQEGREKHVFDTLAPWAELWSSEANTQMIWQNPLWNYHWWEFDLSERVRPDLAAMADIMMKMMFTMTTNERRRFLKLKRLDIPEADTVFLPSGTSPLGEGYPMALQPIIMPDGTIQFPTLPGAPPALPPGEPAEPPEGGGPDDDD